MSGNLEGKDGSNSTAEALDRISGQLGRIVELLELLAVDSAATRRDVGQIMTDAGALTALEAMRD